MLFSYQYVPHQMEKMQEFIDFIFFDVWCKAPEGLPFSLDLFNGNAELKEVMEAFHYSDAKGADFFNGHVECIYGLFAPLTPIEIDKFQQWYKANNDIEKVCGNDPAVHIARYADIEATYPDLSEQLALFFKGLYSDKLLGLKALREKIGQIDDHYDQFMGTNKEGKCPFCGISDMLGVYHTKREAYDHYLPKGLYPFNSINFRNLVPACHHCNSSYKLEKDPSFTPKDRLRKIRRRKALYPYSSPTHKIEISIDLRGANVDHLTPSDIQLIFGPSALAEEIETWKDVYGIEERFKAKCCHNDAKDWLEQIRILHDLGKLPEESLAMVRQQSEKDPIANSNFLKIAFLEGCYRTGIWNSAK
ncbi:hypothetical protein K9N68_39710 (plasmid) [Kovacikia minuta CCNUW1]|uniref:HNH endonuclease n=1 Tax=Kovacikia minuta TaxID=2931930 RepID=UPI001CCE6D39|nr:hypothetical protein [Kovacikia minuta]UBF30782.1 hypothetical protein K9N68_39710 [Kovacikia minuta CCNUW1]